jgi:homoaconitate hydratase
MSGQTLAEKIATRYRVRGPSRALRAGDLVVLRPRHVMSHDNSAAIMDRFSRMGAASVRYSWQPVIAIDHDVQNTEPERLATWRRIEHFAREQGVEFWPCGSGIGHQIMVAEGYVVPGSLCVAADSHANIYGALGSLGTAIVRSDAAAVWATGEFWWKMPRTVQVVLSGRLPDGVTGKDLILSLCGQYRSAEVHNMIVEFVGPGVAALEMDDRFTVANMTTEWGALAGIFPVDRCTTAYLERVRRELIKRGRRRFTVEQLEAWGREPVVADGDADYAGRIHVELESIRPVVAGPDSVSATKAVGDRVAIDKAFLVGCVNSRLSDLRAAAEVLRGKQVHERVEFYVAAASREVQDRAVREGIWQDLIQAGARTLPPGCAMCIGLGEGILTEGEVAISATNRNFPGRMGATNASSWLASPAVVAASALAGVITAPESVTVGTLDLRSRFEPGEDRVEARERSPLMDGFPRHLTGRALFVPADDLDTDQIYPGTAIYRELDQASMKRVLMQNHDPNFASLAREGDILVGGFNFGCGSSREQALTGLVAAGIRTVITGSVSATFLRNAFSNAVICVECPELVRYLQAKYEESAARTTALRGVLEVDFRSTEIQVDRQMFAFAVPALPLQELVVAGGIEAQVRRRVAGTGHRTGEQD